MTNTLNSVLYVGMWSARSIVDNLKKKTAMKKIAQDKTNGQFKSLFVQIQAMADLDNSTHLGKNLNIII